MLSTDRRILKCQMKYLGRLVSVDYVHGFTQGSWLMHFHRLDKLYQEAYSLYQESYLIPKCNMIDSLELKWLYFWYHRISLVIIQ